MMHKKMCGGHKVAWLLLVIGGLNWGLVGVLDFNLVTALFGGMPWLEKLVYILVGVSALMMLAVGKCCMKGKGGGCADGKCGCGTEKCPDCGKSPCACGEKTEGGDEGRE